MASVETGSQFFAQPGGAGSADGRAGALRQIIEAQRDRIRKAQQLAFNFDHPTADETEQVQSERKHMKERLDAIAHELQSEPAELKALYDVALQRLEPIGLVYLWPTTRL